MAELSKKFIIYVTVGIVLLSNAACVRGERLRNGDDSLPPATQTQLAQESTPLPLTAITDPTSEPGSQQPTTSVIKPTAIQEPTESSLSDQAVTVSEELESMLNELDRMNQSADSLEDVP